MKSNIVIATTEPVSEYPCLKFCKEPMIVVLFSSQSKGVVVHCDNESYELGDYSSTWAWELFQPFKNEIVLKN